VAAPVVAASSTVAISTYTGSAVTKTANVPVPAGVVAGSLVMLGVWNEPSTDVAATSLTIPAGFTLAARYSTHSVYNQYAQVLWYYRYATGAESGTYAIGSPTTYHLAGVAVRVTGGPTSGDPTVYTKRTGYSGG
jgi:hypothetical protein